MKISEFIAILQNQIEQHGDIKIAVPDSYSDFTGRDPEIQYCPLDSEWADEFQDEDALVIVGWTGCE